MQTWYECKVKYLKIDQGGFERKVNDNYLLDAVSYTDAETRIFQQMQEITNGDFQVMNIKKSNITEVIAFDSGEWFYKAKINLISIDEDAGKEKKITNYILVMADDIKDALKRLEEGLAYMLVPYVVTSLQLSTIAEVFPYNLDEASAKMVQKSTPVASTPAPFIEEEELEEEGVLEEIEEEEELDSDEDENEETEEEQEF